MEIVETLIAIWHRWDTFRDNRSLIKFRGNLRKIHVRLCFSFAAARQLSKYFPIRHVSIIMTSVDFWDELYFWNMIFRCVLSNARLFFSNTWRPLRESLWSALDLATVAPRCSLSKTAQLHGGVEIGHDFSVFQSRFFYGRLWYFSTNFYNF